VSALAADLEQVLLLGEMDLARELLEELRLEMGRAADALRREFPTR
jgi:hypothetical protein